MSLSFLKFTLSDKSSLSVKENIFNNRIKSIKQKFLCNEVFLRLT